MSRIRSLTGLLTLGTWKHYHQTYKALRAGKFDLCISVYGQPASLWAGLSGATKTVGYGSEAYPHLLSKPLPGGRHSVRMHEVDYVRQLAENINATFPVAPSITVGEKWRASTTHRLHDLGVRPSDTVIVIHAGANNGSAKRWPAHYWGAFTDALRGRTSAHIILIGSEGDRSVALDVQRAAQYDLTSFVGETDIPTLVALLDRADLVVSGDSGPLHVAVALGRPLLAVYGPTDPQIYGPYRPTAATKVLRADIPCSPCYSLAASAECPLGDPICMRLVRVDDMVNAALELLH
ncbi:MAG: hypothetical protein NVSMB52_01080 [Chloroflexota bacterium]